MSNISAPQIILLLVVLLLPSASGARPEIGRSLGSGMREFKDSVSGVNKSGSVAAELPAATVDTVVTTEPREN